MRIKNCIRGAFLIAILELVLIASIAFFLFTHDASAGDLSTWRYGSPNDVRQAGLRAARCGNNHALATWMDIAFRAGSPELYRYTQRQPAQIIINNNVINPGANYYNNEPTRIIDYNQRRPANHWAPQYPKELLP